jgi:hypothetical protein
MVTSSLVKNDLISPQSILTFPLLSHLVAPSSRHWQRQSPDIHDLHINNHTSESSTSDRFTSRAHGGGGRFRCDGHGGGGGGVEAGGRRRAGSPMLAHMVQSSLHGQI